MALPEASKLKAGQAGQRRQELTESNLLWSRIESDRPPSVYEFQDGLRRLLTARDWNQILPSIVRDPKKHYLLRAFVLAERSDVLDKQGDAIANGLEPYSLPLVVRDKIEECRQWEESLTPTMTAARCGDLAAFNTSLSDSPDFVNETDSMGNNVWFWAFTGGNMDIIDELCRRITPVQGSHGRNVLHAARYAAPTTVEYILSSLDISDLVNQRDHYNERDQYGVHYYTTVMGEQKWMAGKIDRNRLPHRLATVGPDVNSPEKMRSLSLLSIISEGNGDELDEESKSELEKVKRCSHPRKPDRSPLHQAVEVGNFKLAEALLKKGANANQRDWFGMTPLHTAAKCGNADMVKLLLRAVADLTLVDNTNSTPLQVAWGNGHRHLEELLS